MHARRSGLEAAALGRARPWLAALIVVAGCADDDAGAGQQARACDAAAPRAGGDEVAPRGDAAEATGSDATDIASPCDAAHGEVRVEDAGVEEGSRPTIRILFLGNSYTSSNDLPELIRSIGASADRGPRFAVKSITAGGAHLSDHWNAEAVHARIERGELDFVVLQDASLSPLPANRSEFDAFADLFAEAAHAAGAQPVFFGTWARAMGHADYGAWDWLGGSPQAMEAGLTTAIRSAAERTRGRFAPVGSAFTATIAQRPEPTLYTADGSHPSLRGSWLAACVFYIVLTGGEAVPDATIGPAGLDPEDDAFLRAVALRVVQRAWTRLEPEPIAEEHSAPQYEAAVQEAIWAQLPSLPVEDVDPAMNVDGHSRALSNGVTFVAAQHGLAVTNNWQLYESIDGGQSWSYAQSLPPHATWSGYGPVRFRTTRDGIAPRGYVLGMVAPFTSELYETDDGGESWRRVPEITRYDQPYVIGRPWLDSLRAQVTWAHGVRWLTDREAIVSGTAGYGPSQRAVVLRTLDAGASFDTLYMSAEHSAARELEFPTRSVGYAALDAHGEQDMLLKTIDGGRTWIEKPRPLTPQGILFFASENVGWLYSPVSKACYRTVDGGETWAMEANRWQGMAVTFERVDRQTAYAFEREGALEPERRALWKLSIAWPTP